VSSIARPHLESQDALASRFTGDEDVVMMPLAHGPVRGRAIAPIHPSAPAAAARDPKLHRRLAIIDALRVGGARDRAVAAEAASRVHVRGDDPRAAIRAVLDVFGDDAKHFVFIGGCVLGLYARANGAPLRATKASPRRQPRATRRVAVRRLVFGGVFFSRYS